MPSETTGVVAPIDGPVPAKSSARMDQATSQCFAEAIEKCRTRYVRAEILDRDNQPIATGAASPKADGSFPVFHIDYPEDVDTLAVSAAILRRSDGTTEDILRCTRCPHSRYSMHFHLETSD